MTDSCPTCGDELNADNAAGGLCGRCLFERGIEFASTLCRADGSTPGSPRFTAPDPVEVEADLLSFDVLELVGQGGMGAVYKARQRNLDRTVAIKILPRQSAGGEEFAERFQREARALARLRHEHIVMAYDFGLTDRFLYSVMEYVGGPNLREYLRSGQAPISRGTENSISPRLSRGADDSISPQLRRGTEDSISPRLSRGADDAVPRLSPRHALEIARDICAGLRFAHENGVAHRDIKPENILLDESGRVKIADFGLAKLLQADPRELALTHTRHFMGTLHYMAPEQCERPHETDHRADIYSLGVVMYEMLTGELPIGRFDPPSCRANVATHVDGLVMRALEKDPARRYQSAAEFGEEIAEVLEVVENETTAPATDDAPTTVVPPSVERIRRRTRPRGPLVAAGFCAFFALAWFGWQFILKYQRDKEGNTSLSVEAEGGEGETAKLASDDAASPDTSGSLHLVPSDEDIVELRKSIDRYREAYDLWKSVPNYESNPEFLRTRDALNWLKKHHSELLAIQKKATETANQDSGGPIGPVQIEFSGPDQSQLILRGDRKDVERVQKWINDLETSGDIKPGEKPEDFIRRLRDTGTKKKADAAKSEQLAQVFRLKSVKASDITEKLRNVLGPDSGRIEPDNRTNSIIVLADRETMSKIEAIILRLEEAGTRKDGAAEMEMRIQRLQPEIDSVNAEIEREKAVLSSYDDREDTPHNAAAKVIVRSQIENAVSRLKSLQRQKSIAADELARFKERTDASDLGQYPEALLMDEIRRDPEMIELRKKIADAEELLDVRKNVAKNPQNDPAVLRSAERLKEMREVEEQLRAQLREIALAKRKYGAAETTSPGGQIFSLARSPVAMVYEALRKHYPDSSRVRMAADTQRNALIVSSDPETLAEIEAIVRLLDAPPPKGAKAGRPKDEIKIFTLQNSRAAEANEMLRKLYPDSDAVRMTADNRTNSLIVEGDRDTLAKIEAILLRLDSESRHKDDAKNPAAAKAPAKPPLQITAQFHRTDRMLRVPYDIGSQGIQAGGTFLLVAKGPRIGRLEFDVSNVFNNPGYGSGPGPVPGGGGLLTSAKGLTIPRGEQLEVFIEQKKPGDSDAVRVSNIVKLTWDLTDKAASENAAPATDKATPKAGTESYLARLQILRRQLQLVEEELRGQIPNAVEGIETKKLRASANDLRQRITELALEGPNIERVQQPPGADPLDTHPELVHLRRELGKLNAAIARERGRLTSAEEPPRLLRLKQESRSSQQMIWDLEAKLRKEATARP